VRALKGLATPVKRLELGERMVRRNPLYFPKALRRFRHLADIPLERRRAWASGALARALRAVGRTRYGRALGTPRALEDWPLLDPVTVRRSPGDFMHPGWWSIPSSTGGTTGIPLPLLRSPRSVAVEQAALDHLLLIHGVDARRARVAVLRGDDVKDPSDRTPPFWIDAIGGRRRIFSSNHLGRDTARDYVEALRAFAPDYWWVYPTALESLVRLTRELGLELHTPLVLSSSEVLGSWCRTAARESFGARIVDYYGQAERVAFAYSSDESGWRFLPGYAHVELIPVSGADATLHEIVGTVLWNEAMPLVRYRTGDLIRLEAPPAPAVLESITLGLTPFPGVLGRDGDILIAPDGTRLTGIDHFQRGVERIVRIQVVHERPSRVEIRVVPAPGYGEAQRAQLLANARRKVPDSIEVTVREVNELERTALGKTPFVLRRPGVMGPGTDSTR
jgi:phenylacetate-CoA ligase